MIYIARFKQTVKPGLGIGWTWGPHLSLYIPRVKRILFSLTWHIGDRRVFFSRWSDGRHKATWCWGRPI